MSWQSYSASLVLPVQFVCPVFSVQSCLSGHVCRVLPIQFFPSCSACPALSVQVCPVCLSCSAVLVWYIPVHYVPVRFIPGQYDPKRYIVTSLRPHKFHPWTAGSFHPWKVTLSLKVCSFVPEFINCMNFWSLFCQIYFNPFKQFRQLLTVLEYYLIDEKFPPTTAQCTLYTVKKKMDYISKLWHFFLTMHFYIFSRFLSQTHGLVGHIA